MRQKNKALSKRLKNFAVNVKHLGPVDETAYLLSSKTNRTRLKAAIDEMNNGIFLKHPLIEKYGTGL